ncbi:MAG TPA: YifB family Mg chelatase-like AAA ATPase [Candidatus Woesebacteria bacterium]|nr:YifB family Mg chelatase-like AAA ATPase [Candidatus Woesebacteria bacterium]
MLARVYSANMVGLEPIKIEVEVDGSIGVPNLIFIGLANKTIDEARERITSALLHSGIQIQSKRTLVNLAPADLQKTGSALELSIAAGLLKMYEEITANTDDTMFFGELSLDGSLKKIKGALPLALAARQMGFHQIFVPRANSNELEIISDLTIFPIDHLTDLINHYRNKPLVPLEPKHFQPHQSFSPELTFDEIAGQAQAKRALEIAAAGGHNLLMIGPPGAGKSMLANALVSILPPLSETEAIEVSKIYSIVGLNPDGLITFRPFRAPHHTTSQVGLIGGGTHLKPGEISLAHRGVLFLDELPEFPRICIEALRQPLENGQIELSRATGSARFPARFILVAAANPCPCGYLFSNQKPCRCSLPVREKYYKKLSGPILDRIDLHIYVQAVPTKNLTDLLQNNQDSTQDVNQRIALATKIQMKRYEKIPSLTRNSELSSKQVKRLCQINPAASQLLNQASSKLNLSVRGYFKVIKVAQTIADLDGNQTIDRQHIGEALQYRQLSFDRSR